METLTWFDIETYVLDGDDCDAIQQQVLHADMVSTLVALWARCEEDRFYETVITAVIPASTSSWPLTSIAADIHKITGMDTRNTDNICILLQTTDVTCLQAAEVMPTHFEVKGYGPAAAIHFNTATDNEYTFTVTYQRHPATSILVTELGIDTYQIPDVPPQLYSVLRDFVKARRFAAIQDWSNASPQLQLANNAFDAIKPALEKGDGARGPAVTRMSKEGDGGADTIAAAASSSSILGATTTFAGLTDTSLSGAVVGDTVIWNPGSSKWEASTPAILGVPNASATQRGSVELLTVAELNTGIDAYRAATAAVINSSARSVKLDAVEALADVTDIDNVRTAGALMDDEVSANLKTFVVPASTTISSFIKTLVDDTSDSTARATLNAQGTTIGDSGNLITATTVETAFQEIFNGGGHAVSMSASGVTNSLGLVPYHRVTLTADATLQFDTPATQGHTFRVRVEGAFTPTWPASVEWANSAPPVYTSPSLFVFSTDNGGSRHEGVMVGAAFA